MFAIRDKDTKEYYRRSCGTNGWYSPDIETARVYTLQAMAQRTIDAGNHHVTHPGNRQLEIVLVEFNISE